MGHAGLDESQAGIKTARSNINNLRYAGDTTLIAESEELRSLLIKVKEESEKAGLKLNIQKSKIMASRSITSLQIKGKKWKMTHFISWAPKIIVDSDYSHEIKKHSLLGKKNYNKPR